MINAFPCKKNESSFPLYCKYVSVNIQLNDGICAATTVKCLQWTLWCAAVVLCGWMDVCESAGGTFGQIIFTSGRWALPRVNPESCWMCRMAQILRPDVPRPWLEAFFLRAGSRAEERGLAIDWFSSLALACIPRFRRPGSSHWFERPRWSFFYFARDFLNELLSVSWPLSVQDS